MALTSFSAPPLVADSPNDLPLDVNKYAVGQEFFVNATAQTFRVAAYASGKRYLAPTQGPQGLPGTSGIVGLITDAQLAAPNRSYAFDASGLAAAALASANAHTDGKLPASTVIDATGASDQQVLAYTTASGKVVPITIPSSSGTLAGLLASRPSASSSPGATHYATDSGLTSDQRLTRSDGAAWHNQAPVLNFLSFGADPTGATFSDAAWTAAMAAVLLNGTGTTLRVPRGTYKFAAAIHVTAPCHVLADGSGIFNSAVVFEFPPGCAGLILPDYYTPPGGGRADSSIVEGVLFTCTTIPVGPPAWAASHAYASGAVVRPTVHNRYSYVCTTAGTSGSTEPTWPLENGEDNPALDTVTDGGCVWQCQWANGITMRCRATLRDCMCIGFEGDGVNIYGNVGAGTYSNANGFSLDTVRVSGCNGNGVYVHDDDSNAGLSLGVDVDLSNLMTGLRDGMAGIYDNSFINGTWVAAEVAFCRGPAYQVDNGSGPSILLVGCYAEQGGSVGGLDGGNGPARLLSGNVLAISGFLACGFTSDSGCIVHASGGVNFLVVRNPLGLATTLSSGSMYTFQAAAESGNYRFNYSTTGPLAGWYGLTYAGLDAGYVALISGDQSSVGPHKLLVQQYYTGILASPTLVIPHDGYGTLPGANTSFDYGVAGFYNRRLEFTASQASNWTLTLFSYDLSERWIWNHTSYVMTIASSGTSITIAAGLACWISHDGANVRRMTSAIDPTT